MPYIIVGLGNPGEEYERSRHNTGRIILEALAEKRGFSEWKKDKKLNALVSDGEIAGEKVGLLLPETFMNKSGLSVKKLITSPQKAKKCIVVHDDIDLPLGRFKVSYGRGAGGHNGVASIVRSVSTKDFPRIRVGVSPAVRGSNRPRKPQGEKNVIDFLMGEFRKPERVVIDLAAKDVDAAIEMIIEDGVEAAMNEFN